MQSENKKSMLIFYGVMAGIVILRLIGIININIVSGQSMEPNYYEGELLLSSNIPEITRNSVVVARSPNGKLVIKRLIGMPGDTLEFEDGKLFLNGTEAEEPYVQKETCQSEKDASYTLSDSEYFIAGDNRCHSLDSRAYGPISKNDLIGSIITKITKRSG